MASTLIEVLRAATQSGATEVVMETGQPILYATGRGSEPKGGALTEAELFELLTGVLDENQQVDLAVGNVVEFELASDPGQWHVVTEPGPDGVSVRARQAGKVRRSTSGVDLPPAAPFSDPGLGDPSGPQPVPAAVPDPMDDPFAAPISPPPPATDESAFGTPAAANDPPEPPDPADPLEDSLDPLEDSDPDFGFVDPFATDTVPELELERPRPARPAPPAVSEDDSTVRDAPAVKVTRREVQIRDSSPRMTLTDMGQFSRPDRTAADTRKTARDVGKVQAPGADAGTRKDLPALDDRMADLDLDLNLEAPPADTPPPAQAEAEQGVEAEQDVEAHAADDEAAPAVPEARPATITAELSGFSELPAGVAEQLEAVPPASLCFVHSVHAQAVCAALGDTVLIDEGADPAQLAAELATQRTAVSIVVGVDDPSAWLGFILRRVEEGRRVFIQTWATTPEGARRVLLGATTPTRGEVWLDSHPQTSLIETGGAWELFPL